MKNTQRFNPFASLTILLIVAAISMGFLGDDKTGKKTNIPKLYKVGAVTDEGGKKGDAYRLFVNNINLPMNSKGIIAAVNIEDPNPIIGGSGGRYGQHGFLFSSGFYLSGYAGGTLFTNAVASASLVEDYIPGLAGTKGDPRAQIYVLKSSDPAFGTAWQDWKDAVDLGADFYDGDGDGIYSPSDKNGNGTWDSDEDRPDLLGDETVWTVYWDGVAAAQRRWNNVDPLGIEVRQTVFAYQSAGAIGNLIFVRYRFKYVGLGNSNEPNQLDDVFFGVWADPDLGEVSGFSDDLVGVDVPRNAGYTYNDGDDVDWGSNPPCFMIDYFSGPIDYIAGETYTDENGNGIYDAGDIPLDTAYSSRGLVIGMGEYPGAKNLPISSFVEYINGDPTLSDPSTREEARNLMLGKTKAGADVDVCTFSYGNGASLTNCALIDPKFWYSGDPVSGTGWLNTVPADLRQMTNTGPFILQKGEEKEIVVAYVVGQGENALNSIEIARDIDDGAQIIFNRNFLAPSPPPPPLVTTQSNEDYVDLIWDTKDQVTYRSKSDVWDLKFGGYNIFAAKSFNSSEIVDNQNNFELIGRFQADNFINNLYYKDGKTGGIQLLYSLADSLNLLDTNLYKDSEAGRLRFRITEDPFTGGPLVKGKSYYFVVTSYAVNFDALVNKSGGSIGTIGDYYLTDQTFVQAAENPKALSLFKTVLMGEDIYIPPIEMVQGNKMAGVSNGVVAYDIVSPSELKDNEYQVTFFKDESSIDYKMFWELKNLNTGAVLEDSGDYYLYNEPFNVAAPITDGFITKIQEVVASTGTPQYSPVANTWFDSFNSNAGTGAFYVGKDIPDGTTVALFKEKQSNYITADRLRNIEIRFDQNGSGKAYRYLNGFKGTTFTRLNSYSFAAAITATDTINRTSYPIGEWNTLTNTANGFVDVPFTAWVVDENYPGDQRQLAVGFVERARNTTFPNGKPDGIWDPGDSLNLSGEVIIVFDAEYDQTGSQVEYTGGDFTTGSGVVTVWADLLRVVSGLNPIPVDAQGITEEQKEIFLSPWFNALYVVGLQKKNPTSFYSNGDKLTVPVDVYPYTTEDVYRFSVNSNILTDQQSKDLFEKVNVFPNPLYGYNPYTANYSQSADDPFVTFTNLPNEEITIKIFSLSGQLLRTLVKDPNSTSPFLQWNLQNEAGLRVASGLYLAIVTSPKYGDKVLKVSIIMPQKQLPRY
jgi:hypothetical protein